ncbi:hypothetical protein IVG45_17130 [Methylomonas sp. LL1]|uniref:ankyrin repeat domain-containing protein n=1 Tax=Methylomonas sp. LL1 TaxID=2785785 RepID=UPI0018C389D6|nr:ankyrin repeat domain-containing protein [Methylomonas sp. LL1]QPK62557.1 hypothetical protein IVG45_17130 [Methylomonas sp. LL1]
MINDLDRQLIWSAHKGYKDLSDLIDKGANINVVCCEEMRPVQKGFTPLMAAIHGNQMESFELLIEKGANVNLVPDVYNKKSTPLILAADLARLEYVNKLISAKATVDLPNKNGRSALSLICSSCKKKHIPILEALLVNNANINLQDKRGYTPFFYAAKIKSPDEDFIKILLNQCIDYTIKDKSGKDAYIHSKKNMKSLIHHKLESLILRNDLDDVPEAITEMRL